MSNDELELGDDEHGEAKTGTDDGDRDGDGLSCPECGKTFSSKLLLGSHRFREHGVRGSSKSADKRRRGTAGKRRRSSSSTPPDRSARSKRARMVAETATELADLFEGSTANVDSLTIAGVIRRDADRMGDTLAALAERSLFGWLGPVIDNLFGAGGPLSFLRAFGPTARKFLAARPARPADDDAGSVDPALQAEFEARLERDGLEAATAWAQAAGLEVQA